MSVIRLDFVGIHYQCLDLTYACWILYVYACCNFLFGIAGLQGLELGHLPLLESCQTSWPKALDPAKLRANHSHSETQARLLNHLPMADKYQCWGRLGNGKLARQVHVYTTIHKLLQSQQSIICAWDSGARACRNQHHSQCCQTGKSSCHGHCKN